MPDASRSAQRHVPTSLLASHFTPANAGLGMLMANSAMKGFGSLFAASSFTNNLLGSQIGSAGLGMLMANSAMKGFGSPFAASSFTNNLLGSQIGSAGLGMLMASSAMKRFGSPFAASSFTNHLLASQMSNAGLAIANRTIASAAVNARAEMPPPILATTHDLLTSAAEPAVSERFVFWYGRLSQSQRQRVVNSLLFAVLSICLVANHVAPSSRTAFVLDCMGAVIALLILLSEIDETRS